MKIKEIDIRDAKPSMNEGIKLIGIRLCAETPEDAQVLELMSRYPLELKKIPEGWPKYHWLLCSAGDEFNFHQTDSATPLKPE